MGTYRSTILLVLFMALSGCATSPGRDKELVYQGQEAAQGGDTTKAEELLKQALAENPDNPHALVYLSDIYIAQSRYDAAKPLCERVVAKETDDGQAAVGPEESQEMSRLVQRARENLQAIARGEAEEQELLALSPDGSPAVAPLTRDPAPAPTPVAGGATTSTSAATTAETAALPASPAVTASTNPTTASAPFRYRIQVGAFKSRRNAERLGGRLGSRYPEAMREKEVVLTDAAGLTRVEIGPYANMREANEACSVFTKAGLRCFPKGRVR